VEELSSQYMLPLWRIPGKPRTMCVDDGLYYGVKSIDEFRFGRTRVIALIGAEFFTESLFVRPCDGKRTLVEMIQALQIPFFGSSARQLRDGLRKGSPWILSLGGSSGELNFAFKADAKCQPHGVVELPADLKTMRIGLSFSGGVERSVAWSYLIRCSYLHDCSYLRDWRERIHRTADSLQSHEELLRAFEAESETSDIRLRAEAIRRRLLYLSRNVPDYQSTGVCDLVIL
jgi:hypothetical protein